jgi:protein tyrosine phosphatase (PTP) superfamily phosphohydrolase (DUF442 family)
MLKRLTSLCLAWSVIALPAFAAGQASCPIPGDSKLIYRLAWVDAGKYMRSGAVVVDGNHLAGEKGTADNPAVESAYRVLGQKYHVGAVINLRAESAEDEAAAHAAGMSYLHLPIPDGEAPTPAQVKTFFQFLHSARGSKKITLWHCAGGIGRTGVLAGMLRLREGWSTKAAADEMFGMGLTYDQATEDLPALNGFALALGKPGYFPANWHGPRKSRFDYKPILAGLPALQ